MEFTLPPNVEEYRREIKAIIAEVVTPEIIDRQHRTGTFNSYELNRALAERGFLERAVPGLGKGDPIELFVLFNELEKAGVPYDGISVAVMVAGVINHVGTPWQKEQILPSILTGEALVCMGYSEPDYGSDVASIVTRAVRDGDEWIINGAKMWTTMAHEAKWLILLTRTDPDVPKHKGLTMFILPMSTPGITIEPVPTMGTEHTNATFYDNVRVGNEWVLGEVNGGWRVMGVALSFERGVMGGTNPAVPLLRHFREWAEESGRIADPITRERMARVAIDNEVSKLLTQRSAWIAASGGLPGLEGSMTKVFATEAFQKACKWFQQMAAAEGLLQFHEPGAAADGWIEYDARHSPVMTIYGGTSEINRNNIAERHLGLPKARR
ncbi:MAG TPA: acyl-CoA dehydrogenase family protein [Acidimicrobiales bacterium]|jgi:alkylation response protein AidB-like acyl-CoA dehydrogenase|nr:acyl-CoA dehydrogenase family protein [Acidimicrobiales bacterium]